MSRSTTKGFDNPGRNITVYTVLPVEKLKKDCE